MPEWNTTLEPIGYDDARAKMETRVNAMVKGEAEELVWLLEHPSLYTAGTSADPADLLAPQFPVYETGRGGEYTYHGPGQRVAYVMLDLNTRGRDIKKFIWKLEEWIIQTLAQIGITCERREGRVGIWVAHDDGSEAKIAAIGIRARKWVTYHGIAINVNPDLSHFAGIVPCGIKEHGVTSLHQEGLHVSMKELDTALQNCFEKVFYSHSE